MNAIELELMLAYLKCDAGDRDLLRGVADALRDRVPRMVDDFYERILADEPALRVMRAPDMVEGLKRSLSKWAEQLLDDPSKSPREWLEMRRRIGLRHVEVGLPPRYMPLAMNVVRTHLHAAVCDAVDDRDLLFRTIAAVDRALDLELAVMTESYRQLAEDELRRTERLATLGRLAAGVSHELKNPIGIINTGVLVLTSVLERDHGAATGGASSAAKPAARSATNGDDDDDATADAEEAWRAPLDRVARGARQARELAGQLLEFVRVRTPRIYPNAVRSVIAEGISAVDEASHAELVVDVEPDDLRMPCDAADLARAIANLIRNACQSIGDAGQKGSIAIRAREVNGALQIDVVDDGPGVSGAHEGRIFEPLFTTRANGTGLGLAIARDLVDAQGGSLTLVNPGERGAHFRIVLRPTEPPPHRSRPR